MKRAAAINSRHASVAARFLFATGIGPPGVRPGSDLRNDLMCLNFDIKQALESGLERPFQLVDSVPPCISSKADVQDSEAPFTRGHPLLRAGKKTGWGGTTSVFSANHAENKQAILHMMRARNETGG